MLLSSHEIFREFVVQYLSVIVMILLDFRSFFIDYYIMSGCDFFYFGNQGIVELKVDNLVIISCMMREAKVRDVYEMAKDMEQRKMEEEKAKKQEFQ